MSKSIRPTTLSIIIAVIVFGLLFGLLFGLTYYYGRLFSLILILGVFFVLFVVGMFYRLMSVSADENEISINRFLRNTKIPMSEITSVKEYPHPTGMAAILGRKCIWGESGWFEVSGEGKCFGYLDNPKDCILVTLKSGKKYLLACENPSQMVEDIEQKIK